MTGHAGSAKTPPLFDGGLYVFLMRLREFQQLEIGALGEHAFPPGWYLYVGSARRGLAKRVERHWSLKKAVRWHIDYLSTAVGSEPVGAVIIPTSAGLTECEVNQKIGLMDGNQTLVSGFGASDCRAGCPAHLWYSRTPVSLLTVARVHPQAAVLIPGAGVWEATPQELADFQADLDD